MADVKGIIVAGIRQYCSDTMTEYAYHEPSRDLRLLARLDADADALAEYIISGLNGSGIVGFIDATADIKPRRYTDDDFQVWADH